MARPPDSFSISRHAISRFIERVRPCTDDEAREALTSRAILAAAAFGAPFVRLATGQRIVIEEGSVVTVLPKEPSHKPMGRRIRRTASENDE